MKTAIAEHVLNGREAMRIGRLRPCTEIECRLGVIWVTFTGDPVDYLLRAGERRRVDPARGAVVSSLGSSAFALLRDRACREHAPVPGLGMAAST